MNLLELLPMELLHEIARDSESAYKALLSYPRFARAVEYDRRLDYMVLFGHDVRVVKRFIKWSRNGVPHRLRQPAHTHEDGSKYYYQNGNLHRDDGPALIEVVSANWYRSKISAANSFNADNHPKIFEGWFIRGVRVSNRF